MKLINYIVSILLSLDPSYSDKETWAERTTRMEIIAEAIDDASSKATCEEKYNTLDCKKKWINNRRSLTLLLITKGFWESKFAKNVHEGKCRPYECDSYTFNGNTFHRARSPWQIQRTGLVMKEEYDKMNSSTRESTVMSANVAVRYLAMGMNSCKTITGTMAIYGGAKSCNWDGVAPRVEFYNRLQKMEEKDIQKRVENQKLKLDARLISNKNSL